MAIIPCIYVHFNLKNARKNNKMQKKICCFILFIYFTNVVGALKTELYGIYIYTHLFKAL